MKEVDNTSVLDIQISLIEYRLRELLIDMLQDNKEYMQLFERLKELKEYKEVSYA